MTLVVSIALLLLTAAVVLLFAMIGELAARLPADDANGDSGAGHATPLDEYSAGTYVPEWPEGLSSLGNVPDPVLLILSPVCNSCNQVATELSALPAGSLDLPVGIVVSSGSAETAEAFLAQHRLGHLPHLVDENGTWVRGTFGVNISPSALLFEKGVLDKAYTFGTFRALRDEIARINQKEEADHVH